jgi:hypothetical protein
VDAVGWSRVVNEVKVHQGLQCCCCCCCWWWWWYALNPRFTWLQRGFWCQSPLSVKACYHLVFRVVTVLSASVGTLHIKRRIYGFALYKGDTKQWDI